MIMLLSFIPVFMLSGREGKLFHPLAFTKSFAMIGVALISVTLVPALIPTFIQGPLAERGRKLDRPQLHQYLQAAAHLGPAAAEPGDVDVRRAAGSGGRHVPAAGSRRAGASRRLEARSWSIRDGTSLRYLSRKAGMLLYFCWPRRHLRHLLRTVAESDHDFYWLPRSECCFHGFDRAAIIDASCWHFGEHVVWRAMRC